MLSGFVACFLFPSFKAQNIELFWYKIDLEEYFAEYIPVLESRELDLTED
jgi:hypothetical protein